MAIHNLQLLTIPGSYKKETLPYGPRACIALESWAITEWPYGPGKKKRQFRTISSDCVTFNEIEGEVDILIQELERIRKQGKGFFKREHTKWLSLREKRSK